MKRHGPGSAERVALLSLFAALGLIAAKLAAGLASGSLAILSEAAHSSLDAGVTALTYVSVRLASKPPDKEHPYGHGRAENLSALIETFALLALSIYIAVQAVARLREGTSEVEATWYGFAVMVVSIVVDFSRARALKRASRIHRSPALAADALHFTADLLTSTAVLVGLVFVSMGFPSADSIASLLIAGYVATASIRLGRSSVEVLMDRAPAGVTERIESAAAGVEGVEEVRRVRVRYAGGLPQTDIVIAISRSVPLEIAHRVTEEVESVIKELEPGADVVVHVEPLANEESIRQTVTSLAALENEVAEVHNVHVTQHADGLHISLHVKFPGEMSLSRAHEIAERLERRIAQDIPDISRVDTHLEPLFTAKSVGRDVTETESTLVAWIKAYAAQLPEVADCHEVVITGTDGGLVMVVHCTAAPGLSVESVHDASTRIEDEVHRRWPQVERVTVHFEPAGS